MTRMTLSIRKLELSFFRIFVFGNNKPTEEYGPPIKQQERMAIQ